MSVHMANLSPIIDISSLYGVESLFQTGTRDPWGPCLAGRLADLFIYSDVVRFIMPGPEESASLDDPNLPSILTKLGARDHGLFAPIECDLEERRTLDSKYLDEAFQNFEGWAQNNKPKLRQLLQLHGEPWIRDPHLARLGGPYVFEVDDLRGNPLLLDLALGLDVQVDDILHGFDVVLRYPCYAERADPERYYFLAHRFRELQRFPTMTSEEAPLPSFALSLSADVRALAPKMTLDEYTIFLHEARGIIRDLKIHTLKPGALNRETIRKVAGYLELPARLRKAGIVKGVGIGLIAAAGAAIGPEAATVGTLVSVAATLWTGTVGRRPARISWLRPALEWEIEKQARDA